MSSESHLLGYHHRKIQDAQQYIDQHYSESICIDEVCRAVQKSRTWLTHYFSRYAGMTIYEYLTRVRIKNACELLLSTDLGLEEVAWRSGYESARSLRRNFKKILGISPNSYRKHPRSVRFVRKKTGIV